MCPNQHWVGSKHIFNPIVHTYVFSVPQDSICGPVLYTVNANTLQHFIKNSGVSLLGYAKNNSALDRFNAKILDDENRVKKN